MAKKKPSGEGFAGADVVVVPRAEQDMSEGEWMRVRLGKDHNGVRGFFLDKLTCVSGEVTIETLHGPDLRDVVLGKLMRAVELAA